MSRLYDDTGRYTDEANELDNKARYILTNIFETAVSQGASPREVSHLLMSVVFELELDAVIKTFMKGGTNVKLKTNVKAGDGAGAGGGGTPFGS